MKEEKLESKEGKNKRERNILAKAVIIYIFLSSIALWSIFKDILFSELCNEELIALFGSFFCISLLLLELYRNINFSGTKKLFYNKVRDSDNFITLSAKVFLVSALIFTSFSIYLFSFFIFTLLSSTILSIIFLSLYFIILLFVTFIIVILVF